MTESLRIGMEAINRWLYHAWNYDTVVVSVPDYVNGGMKSIDMPRFIAEAKWTCGFLHMSEKWKATCSSCNADAYLVTFYAYLDNRNRQILLEWVLENYHDERELFSS